MKKIFFLLFFLWSVAHGQIPGYTTQNTRFNYPNGIAVSGTFTVPAGITPAISTGAWGRAGALFADTTGGNKGLYYYIDGQFIRLYDTLDVVATSATNGITFSGINTVQLGRQYGDPGTSSIFNSNREIALGDIGGNKLIISSDFTSYSPTFPEAKWEFRTATSVFVQSVDGGGIGFVILDSANTLGGTGSGVSYFSGYNRTVQTGTGMHWTSTDKHYFMADMRNQVEYASIEINGVSTANFVTALNGGGNITQLGLLGKVVFGQTLLPATTFGDVDNVGSFYQRDSLMYVKQMFITDSLGYNILLAAKASPYEVKQMSVGALASLLGAGSSHGIDDVLAVGQSLSVGRAINLNSFYLRLNSGGLGIGITPAYKFQVEESTASDFIASIKNTHSSGKGLSVSANNTSGELFGVYGGSSGVTNMFKVNGNGQLIAPSMAGSSSNDRLVSYVNSSGLMTVQTPGVGLIFASGILVADTTVLLDKLVGTNITGAMNFTNVVTATGFSPTATTATGNRLYLPAANTLGLSINGTGEVQLDATALSPIANDGNALGTATLSWADLFLASGSVINFNNGNVTITQTSGTLTQTGTYIAGNIFVNSGLFGTHVTGENGDLYVIGATGSSSTLASVQLEGATTTAFRILERGATSYSLATGVSFANHIMGTQVVAEFSSGNHPLIAGLALLPPTITTGAATVGNTATLYISAAPSATVSGANRAIWVKAGDVELSSGNLRLSAVATGSSADSIATLANGIIQMVAPADFTGLPYIALTGTSTATGDISLQMGGNDFDIGGATSIMFDVNGGSGIFSVLTANVHDLGMLGVDNPNDKAWLGDIGGDDRQIYISVSTVDRSLILHDNGDDTFFQISGYGAATNGDALTLSDNTTGHVVWAPNLAYNLKKEKTEILAKNGRIFAKDSDDNITQISPHNEKGEWIYKSTDKNGVTTEINMIRLAELLEKVTGEKLIYKR